MPHGEAQCGRVAAHEAAATPGANIEKCLRCSELDYDDARSGGLIVISKKCLVGGRVQGVYYRATTANRARELGVTGYARNLPDGRVEVLAVGEVSAVNALIEWLWEGSSASKVTSVEAIEIELHESQRPTHFETR